MKHLELPPRLEYLTLNCNGDTTLTDSSRHLIVHLLSHPSLTSVHFDRGWTAVIWLRLLHHVCADGRVAFAHLHQLRFEKPSVQAGWRGARPKLQPLVQLFPHLHSLELNMPVDGAMLLQLCALKVLRTLRVGVYETIDQRVAAAFSAHPTFERMQLHPPSWSMMGISLLLSTSMLHALAASRSWHTLSCMDADPSRLQRQLVRLTRRTDISAERKARLQQSLFRIEFWDAHELNRTVMRLWPQ